MRILLINSEFPYPPLTANSLIPYQLLLQWRGLHEVTVFCLAAQPVVPKHLSLIRELCKELRVFPHKLSLNSWARFRFLFSRKPYGVHMFYNHAMMAAVLERAHSAGFDAVVALCINTVQYAAAIADRLPTVATPLDAVSVLYSRRVTQQHNPLKKLYLVWQRWRISSFERKYYRRLGAVVLVSENDKVAIAEQCPNLPLFVAPLGVEINPGAIPRPSAQFVMSANFGYAPNHDAAMWLLKEIWHRIRMELPEARLRLVGRGIAEELFAFQGKDGVEIVGEVASVRDELAAATVALNPMRFGSGVRIKALEAFAAGTPLVSTPMGVEGLPVRDGEEALVVESAEGFAHAAVRLAQDVGLQVKLRAGGLTLVGNGYSWQNYAKVVEEAINSAINNFSSNL